MTTPILHHAPHSRSQMALCMLEELGVAYDLRLVNLVEGEQRGARFHALNAMEKVPVLQHGEATVSETGAIIVYLADAYPQAGLAPAPQAGRERGDYLRWLFFGGNCLEPAAMEVFSPRKQALNPGQASWGDFPRVLGALRERLRQGPYLLGDKFSAADVLVGNQAGFLIKFGSINPEQEPEIAAYSSRCEARPAWQRMRAYEAKHPNPWGG